MAKGSAYSWFVPRVVFPIYQCVSGRRPWSEVGRLRELQWRDRAALEASALRKLGPLLQHAATHVPYYRRLFDDARISTTHIQALGDLADVPVTTRAALRTNFPEGVTADNVPKRRRRLKQTSGSSGRPLEFYADTDDVDARLGSYLFFREWAGAPPWSPRLVLTSPQHFTGHVSGHVNRRLVRTWLRRLVIGEHIEWLLSVEVTLDALRAAVARLARRRPFVVYGYPSYLTYLAARLLDAGETLAAYPTVVITCGETLTPTSRAVIERALRCPVVNHYSTLEVLHLAQTCPDRPERLHVNSERAIVRIVREDGRDAAPGEAGRVLVTDLWNYVMPLINYEIGDIAVAGTPCPCGRGLPTLTGVEGRTAELLRTSAGRLISPAVLGQFLTDVCGATPYILEYQAVQATADSLVLRIVPAARFHATVARDLKAALTGLVGANTDVQIELVDRIPPEPSGKRTVVKTAEWPS
jgi:phenylacetate-CoA ligase